jgi:Chitin binding Peritrophin-A domain
MAGQFAYKKDCSKFNNCWADGKEAILTDCAEGTLWNKDFGRCDFECKNQ